MAKSDLETYREHTNTLEPSDVFVQILHIGMNLVSSSNGPLEQIFSSLFLEVCSVGDVYWTVVTVQGLIDAWIGEMVSFKLSWSVLDL